MTQTDLIHSLAKQTGLTQPVVKNLLALLGQTVEANMRVNDHVAVPGLGKFTPVQCAERQGRNPKTGEPITIPARTKVKFKAAFSVE